jgi:hypothetical protein
MKRRARPVPFARMRADSVLRDLAVVPMAEWPRHLRLARNILSDELDLDGAKAQAVLIASYRASQTCAQAISQRSRDIADFMACLKLRKIFARVAKCARRSTAPLRRVLDRGVCSAIHDNTVDAESMAGLINALVAAFASFPKEESSLTILRAITPRSSLPTSANSDWYCLRRRFAEASQLLQQDYEALRPSDQRAIESALTALRDNNAEFDAADVCVEISRALGKNEREVIAPFAHDLITDYAVAIAQIWRQHGLRAARARNPWNTAYRGKFHRFADLVLTSVVDPWSKRHDGDQREMLASLHKVFAQLPDEYRRIVSPAARRTNVEWLVSEDHVRKALARVQKTTPQTP